MSGKFNFGLDDLVEEESGGRTGARWLAGALGVIFFLLSSLTTYLFFSTYAPALGAWAGPNAPYVAGAIGVICSDFAALAWGYVRAKAATTGAQMTIALTISALDLVLGLLTSALYIVLSTTLASGVRAADGSLTEFGFALNLAGVIVITLALVANFASIYVYQNSSADVRSASASTELAAVIHAGQVKADRARALAVVQRTLAEIMAELPSAADDAAQQNRQGYFAHAMRRGRTKASAYSDHDTVPPPEYADLYHVAKANGFTPEEAAAAIVGMRHNYHEGDRTTPPPDYSVLQGNGSRPTKTPDGH